MNCPIHFYILINHSHTTCYNIESKMITQIDFIILITKQKKDYKNCQKSKVCYLAFLMNNISGFCCDGLDNMSVIVWLKTNGAYPFCSYCLKYLLSWVSLQHFMGKLKTVLLACKFFFIRKNSITTYILLASVQTYPLYQQQDV